METIVIVHGIPTRVPWKTPSWVVPVVEEFGTRARLELVPVSLRRVAVFTPWMAEVWERRAAAFREVGVVGVAAGNAELPWGAWVAAMLLRGGCQVFGCGPGGEVLGEVVGSVPGWKGVLNGGERLTGAMAILGGEGQPVVAVPAVGEVGSIAAECRALWEVGVREIVVEGGEVGGSWWKALAARLEGRGRWGAWGRIEEVADAAAELAAGGCGRVWLAVGRRAAVEAAQAAVRRVQQALPVEQVVCGAGTGEMTDRQFEGALEVALALGGMGCRVRVAVVPEPQWDVQAVRAVVTKGGAGRVGGDRLTSIQWKRVDRLMQMMPDLGWSKATTLGKCLWEQTEKQPWTVILKTVEEHGEIREITLRTLWAETEELAAGLLALGIEKGSRILFTCCRSLAVVPLFLAALCVGAVPAGYGWGLLQSMMALSREVDAAMWVCDDPSAVPSREGLPARCIVLAAEAPAGGGDYDLETVREIGRRRFAEDPSLVRNAMARVRPEDPALLFFSSATTGPSKGVLRPHSFFSPRGPGPALLQGVTVLSEVEGCYNSWVSLLVSALHEGSTLAWRGRTRSFEEVCRIVHPEVVQLFPETCHRLYREMASVANAEGELVARRRLQERFGGNLTKVFVSGGSVSPAVEEGFARWGIPLFRGYGLVETGPVSSAFGGFRVGTVGRLTPGTRVRFAADGEILVKRPHMMLEYWRDPAATQAAFREDGWFATGDLGRLDEEGFLVLHGRKKSLIILSTLARIFPEVVEGAILADPAFAQVMVYGEGRPYLVALVVPAEGEAVLGDGAAAERWYLERVRAALRRLPAEYQVRRLAVLPARWSVEGGELTEAHRKLRRHVIAQKYRTVLEDLYAEELPDPSSAACLASEEGI